MKTMVLQIPDTVDIDQKDVLMVVSTKFYEQGKLSLGQAAEMVGLSKEAFMEVLGIYGVSVINHPASDLDRDVDNAKMYNF